LTPSGFPPFLFTTTMEEVFYQAARGGEVEAVKDILRKNPNLDVNWKNEDDGCTALIVACENDHDSIVSILLAHPDIGVNQMDYRRWSPFNAACITGNTSCVRLLLKDSRVLVNEPTAHGATSLYWAAFNDHLDIIKWWIASGREMDLGTPGQWQSDAIGVAKERRQTEVVALLERFQGDATQTRHAIRVEVGWYDEVAAEMFAIVVFVTDGLLQIEDTTMSTAAARYFTIARRLPLELQIVLCYRQVGSCKEIISGKESEVAFRELARRL